MPKPVRTPRTATVIDRDWLAPNLVRLHLQTDELTDVEFPFTDHYVKLILPPPGADYSWPFDPQQLREQLPLEQQPVLRAYTVRAFDRASGIMKMDLVTHGNDGVAGPWAASVAPGSAVGFVGPGGKWGPAKGHDHFVLVGDEAAAPAIAAAIEALPDSTGATVFLEVEDEAHQFAMPEREDVDLRWVLRGDALPGDPLIAAVREFGVPAGRVGWFVHGVAEMIRDLRRFLFVEHKIPRSDVSISGYWRRGMTDEQWRATKKAFNAAMESEETTS
jgi:putative iron-chelator utilization protein